MTDTSTNAANPSDNRDEEDRANLPMTQLDEEEIAAHSEAASGRADAPDGEGVGIGGEPSRLPEDAGDADDR
ncbi:hypothetical protein ABIQ69_02875 [Agromyces sp. G08B096]|uniref:Multidrug transporter n=1 Tax=Agromyces sp. G08B096 TaxID=3156399 RepID=A0AAU7W986_9MICO